MGNTNSHLLDSSDAEVKKQSIDSQSPDREFKPETSPEPLENFNGASQGFVFSSQAPIPALRDSRFSDQFEEDHQINTFERPSSSPGLVDIIKQEPPSSHGRSSQDPPTSSHHRQPSQELAISEEPTMSSSTKPSKLKKRRVKKSSISNQDSSNAPSAESPENIRRFVPQSSVDLDAPLPYIDAGAGLGRSEEDKQDEGGIVGGMSHSADGDQLDAKARRKQERKERKKARKAEKLRLALLEANPDFGNQSDPTVLAEARSLPQNASDALQEQSSSLAVMSMETADGTQDDAELPKSSKKRKRRSRVAAIPEVDNSTDVHDEALDDPNQLPTPDEDIQANLRQSHNFDNVEESPGPDDTVNTREGDARGGEVVEAATADAQASPLKRKARDSGKKSRKKRKQLSKESLSNPDWDIDDEDEIMDSATTQSQPTYTSKKGGTKLGPQSSAPQVPAFKESSGLGDFAENLYAQRYRSQKSTPTTSNKPRAQDDSPTVALLHRRSQDHSASSRLPDDDKQINPDLFGEIGVEQEQDQEMGLDAEPDEDIHIGDADASEDLDLPYVDDKNSPDDQSGNQYEEMNNADPENSTPQHDSDNEADIPMDDSAVKDTQSGIRKRNHIQLGSEDLGALAGTEADNNAYEHADELSEQVTKATGSQVLTDGTHKSSSSRRLRTYGSKTSTGRKRVAKPSFFEREDDKDDDNVKAFAELPSPAAGVASRKKAKGAAVASSSTPQDKRPDKQLKISTLLTGGSAGSFPTPSSSKNARKIKDPLPSETLNGPFTENEKRNIDIAVQDWRMDKGLTQEEVNDMIHLNPQKARTADFWDHVQAAAPRRKRQKIINQCRRKYHNFVARGTWTQEQDDELTQAFERHGSKYTVIASLINRHPEDVRDRIRNYIICGKNRRTDTWSYEEEQRLIVIMNEAFERIRVLRTEQGDSRPDLQDKREEDLVDWTLVSQNMDYTRSRLQCRTKWKSLSDSMNGGNIDGEVGRSMDEIIEIAREEADSMSHRDRYHIAKAIGKSGVTADSRIPWAKLRSSRVGQKWSRPTLMLVWYRLRHSIRYSSAMTVPEIAEQICSSFRENDEVNFQDPEEMDLDAEYREIEYRIGKILKHNRSKPKTPLLAVKSDESDAGHEAKEQGDDEDNDEDEDEAGEDRERTGLESDEGQEVETDGAEPTTWDMSSMKDLAMRDDTRSASIDLGIGQSRVSEDREIDESVLGSPKKVQIKRNNHKARYVRGKKNHERNDKSISGKKRKQKEVESKVQDVEGHEVRTNFDASSEAGSEPVEANDISLQQRSKKADLKQRSAKASSATTSSRTARQSKVRATKQAINDEKSASSDTDAEDVEDIPARV